MPVCPLKGYDRWQAPEAGYEERVYYHEVDEEEERVTAVIHNPHFPLPGGPKPVSVHLSWSPQQLPRLVQWKMAGAGEHVLGIEPANCHVEGRATEREARDIGNFSRPAKRERMQLTLEAQD